MYDFEDQPPLFRGGGDKMLRNATILALLMLSAACAQLPRAEFQAYREAFSAAQTASAPILESYAVRERATTLADLRTQRNFETFGYFPEFQPGDVVAGSSLGLPPGADAADRAFRAIARYNDTLVALADNRNIDEARTQLQDLTSNLTGIAPQLAPAEQPIKAAANVLVTLLSPAIEADNREEFKRIVVEGHPKVVELIGVLRTLTHDQYRLITRPLQDRWQDEPPNQRAIAQEINAWHRVFSDYVFLLNAMEAKLTLLKDAVENPRSEAMLARAVAGSAELRVYAESLRRSVAELRASR
jgi:hypothetical protein